MLGHEHAPCGSVAGQAYPDSQASLLQAPVLCSKRVGLWSWVCSLEGTTPFLVGVYQYAISVCHPTRVQKPSL